MSSHMCNHNASMVVWEQQWFVLQNRTEPVKITTIKIVTMTMIRLGLQTILIKYGHVCDSNTSCTAVEVITETSAAALSALHKTLLIIKCRYLMV